MCSTDISQLFLFLQSTIFKNVKKQCKLIYFHASSYVQGLFIHINTQPHKILTKTKEHWHLFQYSWIKNTLIYFVLKCCFVLNVSSLIIQYYLWHKSHCSVTDSSICSFRKFIDFNFQELTSAQPFFYVATFASMKCYLKYLSIERG